MIRFLAIALVAVSLTGCASSSGPTVDRLQQFLTNNNLEIGESVRNVSSFQVRGFHSVDDRQVILTAGSKRHYLVKTVNVCNGLRSAFGIAVDNRTSTISRSDSIVIRGTGGRPQKCPIQEIIELKNIEST